MKPSKPYEEVQITPTLIWRWVREGDEYVMRISGEALEAHKAHIEAALAQPEPKSISTNDHLCAMLRQVHDVLACTALPMKRPWVGLTDEELVELRETHGAHIFNLMFAVESKVREKNNGSV